MTQPDLLKQFATQPKVALGFGRSLARKVMKANASLTGAQSGVARLGQDLERIYTSFFDMVKGMQKDADGEPDILEALNAARGTKTYGLGQRLLGDDDESGGALGVTRVIESYEMQGKQHKLKRGEALCRQGDPGNSMFVVMSGKLGVVINGTRVGEIGVGEMVGEISVLLGSTSQPRTADLVAEDKTTVGIIPGDQFAKLVTVQPTMLISILARCANRIENNYAVIADREGREKAFVQKFLGPKAGADPEADYRALAKKLERLIEDNDYPLYREFDLLERGAEKIAGFKEKYAHWLK
jgi:CRP-like cAMP-binding protein